MSVLDWLLDADPAIRWQVLRDLTDAPANIVTTERARIATEGWGAKLLALQGDDDQWAGGAWCPGPSLREPGDKDAQPWMSALPVLQLLCDFGADPAAEPVRRAVAEVSDHCSKIMSIKRKAGGFRNPANFTTAIYFHCGGLVLYPR